jgi:hypothetical protein
MPPHQEEPTKPADKDRILRSGRFWTCFLSNDWEVKKEKTMGIGV